MDFKLTPILRTIGSRLNYIWNNYYCRSCIYAILVVTAFLLTLFLGLLIFTDQWNYITVPSVISSTTAEAEKKLEQCDLRMQVLDSVYLRYLPKGTVVSQHPKPYQEVKQGRKIFVTINASTVRKEKVPNVLGMSLRQAKLNLESSDFVVGKLTFVPDLATNYVIKQTYKGRPVNSSILIPVGSAIDLVLGLSASTPPRKTPNLVGLTLEQAKNRCIELSLNVGKIQFSPRVKTYHDSLNAKIIRQNPTNTAVPDLQYGSSIDLSADLK